MENGSLNATEIAVGSLLAGNRGGYGAGGGAWGGGYGGYGPFASPGANAVRLNRNGQNIKEQGDCTRTLIGQGLDSVRNAFENVTRDNQFSAVTKQVTDAEFRSIDRMRDIECQIIDNAKAAAACCCEAKLTAEKNKSDILAAIAAQGSETITRELAAANSKVNQLETINAILAGQNNNHHHGGGH
jgi:hypothetical protein